MCVLLCAFRLHSTRKKLTCIFFSSSLVKCPRGRPKVQMHISPYTPFKCLLHLSSSSSARREIACSLSVNPEPIPKPVAEFSNHLRTSHVAHYIGEYLRSGVEMTRSFPFPKFNVQDLRLFSSEMRWGRDSRCEVGVSVGLPGSYQPSNQRQRCVYVYGGSW